MNIDKSSINRIQTFEAAMRLSRAGSGHLESPTFPYRCNLSRWRVGGPWHEVTNVDVPSGGTFDFSVGRQSRENLRLVG